MVWYPEQLAEIAISSAKTAEMFEVEPIVAMLSYSSGASGAGKDVDQVRQAVEIAQKCKPDLEIDGPIQYDAAIGPVLQGLNKPVNDLSRGCLVADIVNTVAITAIQAQVKA